MKLLLDAIMKIEIYFPVKSISLQRTQTLKQILSFWHDDVLGTVYCQDKDTKEPVWIESRGNEGGSWWEVNRVPEFYKNQSKTKE